MNNTKNKIVPFILPVIFFLLPWQTRYIFTEHTIVGEVFQYGIVSLFAVELLVVLAYLLYGRLQIAKQFQKIVSSTFLLMGISLASALWAINFDLALGQFVHILVALMLFLLLLDGRTNLQYVAIGLITGLMIPIGLGVWQVVVGTSGASTLFGLAFRDAQTLGDAVITLENGTRILRSYGSFSHPNIFGGYLVVGLLSLLLVRLGLYPPAKPDPAPPGFLKEQEGVAGRVQKIFWPTTFAFLLIGLIITYSQSAWIAIIVALVCGSLLIFFYSHLDVQSNFASRKLTSSLSKLRSTSRWTLRNFCEEGDRSSRSMSLIAGIFSTFVILGSIFGVLTLNSIGAGQSSITERATQYQEWPQVVSDFWMFGSGLGNYTYAIEAFDNAREWWQYQPVHNTPMLIIGELGIVGLILIGCWVVLIDKLNFKRIFANPLQLPLDEKGGEAKPNSASSIKVYRFGSIITLMMGCSLLVIAGLDHYLWSQWSGLALVAYVMAMTARLE